MLKRQIIDAIENCVRERKLIQGKEFIPYPESFKSALEDESEKTLMSDLKVAKESLKKAKKF